MKLRVLVVAALLLAAAAHADEFLEEQKRQGGCLIYFGPSLYVSSPFEGDRGQFNRSGSHD